MFYMSEKPKVQEIQIIYHATTRWPLSANHNANKTWLESILHLYYKTLIFNCLSYTDYSYNQYFLYCANPRIISIILPTCEKCGLTFFLFF